MSDIQLTREQQQAVTDRGGSLLVSAAAGSGKTKVLVERLFRRVQEENCAIDDFLIITYTRAAAAELRGKIARELSQRVAQQPEDEQGEPDKFDLWIQKHFSDEEAEKIILYTAVVLGIALLVAGLCLARRR